MWWDRILDELVWILADETGGGSQPQQPSFVQPPPPQVLQSPVPNPNPAETSRQLFESQLQFNPQLTAQAAQLQQQFAPQLAQSQFDITKQFTPQYRQLYEQSFPTQTQGLETLAQQSLQRFQSPQGLTPEQQSAQDAIRGRAREQLQRSIRESANLGGGLFGGRRELREDRGLSELEQAFATQDIGLQDQRRAQALQEMITAQQVVFPQIQQPGVSQFGQSVTQSPDALTQAILQAQGQYIVNPSVYQQGTPGTPGFFGQFVQGYTGR